MIEPEESATEEDQSGQPNFVPSCLIITHEIQGPRDVRVTILREQIVLTIDGTMISWRIGGWKAEKVYKG